MSNAVVSTLGYAALKTGSGCSFTTRELRLPPVFALPDLRSKTFRTDPRGIDPCVHRQWEACFSFAGQVCQWPHLLQRRPQWGYRRARNG